MDERGESNKQTLEAESTKKVKEFKNWSYPDWLIELKDSGKFIKKILNSEHPTILIYSNIIKIAKSFFGCANVIS